MQCQCSCSPVALAASKQMRRVVCMRAFAVGVSTATMVAMRGAAPTVHDLSQSLEGEGDKEGGGKSGVGRGGGGRGGGGGGRAEQVTGGFVDDDSMCCLSAARVQAKA
eukprot:9140224-Pyramimonas_sp.AAC.1